jgi:transketolase
MSVATDVSDVQLADRCISIRETVMKEASVSGSGHYGPSMSCVEILVGLYYDFLRIRPRDSAWAERDRFVLSKGHACSSLYAVLADLG